MTKRAKETKLNPNCPVSGCRASKPHADDPMVKGMILQFASPEKMTLWTRVAMGELTESICKDLEENRIFAWYTRLRLPEELYIRTLYALFVATDEELPHIISGDPPNGLSQMYSRVNEVVYEGRGPLLTSQPGLRYGTFKIMDILNSGAHGSFPGFMACFGLSRNPENLPSPQRHRAYLSKYCGFLDYMHGMFSAGREKKHVLAGVKNMHKPAGEWAKARGIIPEGGDDNVKCV
jgi:hypothetical protein